MKGFSTDYGDPDLCWGEKRRSHSRWYENQIETGTVLIAELTTRIFPPLAAVLKAPVLTVVVELIIYLLFSPLFRIIVAVLLTLFAGIIINLFFEEHLMGQKSTKSYSH